MPIIRHIKKNLLLSAFFASFVFVASAQNLPYVDLKPLHFGFSLGINSMDFGLTPSNDTIGGKVYNANVGTLKPGFSVGIISDLRLSRYFNLRFTPTLHFAERQINFKTNLSHDSASVVSTPISLPLYIKYSAERKDNFRPYLIGGIGGYLDLGLKKENKLLLKNMDFFVEFGAGCDIYFPFFKLAPEIKYAIGFNDMIDHSFQPGEPKDLVYTQAIKRLRSHMITLTFNFE